ncbi:MAG: hypothetical protein U0414_15435 [Polyangiaceae bacterium]
MFSHSARSLLGLLSVGFLGVALSASVSGCTDQPISSVDDDVEEVVDESSESLSDGAPAEVNPAAARSSGGQNTLDGSLHGGATQQQQNSTPGFNKSAKEDPEPAPWTPGSPDT